MKKYLNNFIYKIKVLLPYLIVFLASCYKPNDSDLGWHLKYGEYFFKHGKILMDNTFSVLMPNYHWVNSSWATDLLSYFTYHQWSFLGLTLLSASVVTLTFYFVSRAFDLDLWEQTLLFPILLYFEGPVNAVSFRGQQLTFLFLSILYFLLSQFQLKKTKYLFFIPILFLVWVNFHGEYLFGLILLIIWMTVAVGDKFINHLPKNEILSMLKIFSFLLIITFLVTLINPFGIGVYKETFRHFFNPWEKYISEWLPFEQLSSLWWNHIIMGIFICFGFISLYFTDKLKNKLPYLGIVLILFILSFIMRRYAWPLYYTALPLLQPLADIFRPPDKKVQSFVTMIVLFVVLFIVYLYRSPFGQFTNMNWGEYCNLRGCSRLSAEYILQNNIENNKLLTLYDWGGWLIWNYPQIKSTIDGRMHLWSDDKGYSAFAEYYPIEQNWKGHDIDQTNYQAAYVSPTKPIYQRLVDLVNLGKWRLVYVDPNSGVFIRNR